MINFLLNQLISSTIAKILGIIGNLVVLVLIIAIISPIVRAIARRLFKSEEILRFLLFPGVFLYSWVKSFSLWLLDVPIEALDQPQNRWKSTALTLSPLLNLIPLFFLFTLKSYILDFMGLIFFSFPVYYIWFWVVSSLIIYGLPSITEILTPVKSFIQSWIGISIIWVAIWGIPIVQLLGIYSTVIFGIYAALVILISRYHAKLEEIYSPSSVMSQYLMDV